MVSLFEGGKNMNIGIDIGGSHIGLGLVNDKGEIIEKIEKNIQKTADMENILVNYIVENVKILLKHKDLKLSQIEKIGIAIPGVIKQNRVYNSNNLGLNDFDLVEKLQTHFNTKIQIRNDAKCAAICEKKYGALKKYNDCVFLCMGTGIGGAVFLQNQLLKPRDTDGFELGHMIIEKNGKKCPCGNSGCFESYCSMKNLRSEIETKLELKNQIKTSDIIKLKEDSKVKEVIEEYIENLSIGIANIINIFAPESICFGGSLVYIKDIILPKLEEKIKDTKLKFDIQDSIKYLTAEYGNDAGIIGSTL